MRFEYRIIPYVGATKAGVFSVQSPAKVAQEIETIVNQFSVEGWDYVRMETVEIIQRAGFWAYVIRARQSTVYSINHLVFRRPVTS